MAFDFTNRLASEVAARGTGVEVTHRITNRNHWAVDLAVWALSMMAQGGTAITGLPPRGMHPEILAPTNPLIIWAFTDLSDTRWKFTKKYMMLRSPGLLTPLYRNGWQFL